MKTKFKSLLILALALGGLAMAAPQASARDHDRDYRRGGDHGHDYRHGGYRDRSVRVYYSREYRGSSYRGWGYRGEPVYYRHARYYPYYEGPRYHYVGHRRYYHRPQILFSFGF